jgi:L-arabinonolactonase
MTEIECVVDAKALLGESTCWDPNAEVLWWIDIYSKLVYRFDPATNQNTGYALSDYPGCIAVRERGGLIISTAKGFNFFDPASGRLQPIVDPEYEMPDTRFNDGKTDRQGRFWSGSMFEAPGKKPEKIASLYRLDTDLSAHRVLQGIGCSNGLAWSPNSQTMYFTDSHTPMVWAYEFDPASGEAGARRSFVDLSYMEGIVDGSTVDCEGCYWLTVPFKGKVMRFDPQGKLMRTIEMPIDLPTCCEFGGRDLDILYVTSATLRRTPEELRGQRNAGGLFAIDVGVRGLPLAPFKG